MKLFRKSHAFSAVDLFATFDFRQIKTGRKNWSGECYANCKKDLCGKIASHFFLLVIQDIIENNVTFKFPLRSRKAYLQMKVYEGDEFNRLYQRGRFSNIDFLASNWKGYFVEFFFQTKRRYRSRPVYLSYQWRDKIVQYTNQGKIWY